MAMEVSSRLTRRALLGGTLGALGAAFAAGVARPLGVAATADDIRYLNDEDNETVLEAVSDGTGLETGAGTAISGRSVGGPGVTGSSVTNIGVFGESLERPGVTGFSTQGSGVLGTSTTGTGVVGGSEAGRGAEFSGQDAQLRLVPARRLPSGMVTGRLQRPERGLRGDFFCDGSGRLWFCRGGTRWVRLA
jgi:hypothetical protein